VLGDERDVGEIEERRHPDAFELVGGMFRTERPEQHAHRVFVALR
jgi:hypothetical protein